MAFTFPLAVADFALLLPIKQMSFRLGRSVTFSETGDGDVITHQYGMRRWGGEIELDREMTADAARINAGIEVLGSAGASFLLPDLRHRGPRADPTGAALGGASPALNAIDPGLQIIGLSGLPAGYVLSAGDYIGWTYGTAPVRHALHRIANTRTAGPGGGLSGLIVTPAVRTGVQVGAAVQLIRPAVKAKLIEEDYGMGGAVMTGGGLLKWEQTLR